jgi:hypothetical protein
MPISAATAGSATAGSTATGGEGADTAGTSRSCTSRCSTNCGARASSAPSAVTIMESPSNTSSSWPPTMLTYATVAPASAARRRTSGSRTSSLFSSYGEPLMFTTSPTPAALATANGPPACHRCSQIVRATSTASPPTGMRSTVSASPGTK